ncbi:peptidase M48 [Helicobacter didelphidarum]|uniref:Peptidase M48 n=1 Tax=Helicobacter didelphidarum TaxID=2040648 RepID=A0A3D8IJ64_9HELI|nr:M48 family metallopeptidase [Helicobacter didelphidarum]RDU65262.1 peptidase M48 [Helicobacter didelphidarum]
MYSVIVIYLLFYVAPCVILDILQIRYIQEYAKREPVILNQDDYQIAASYALAKQKISIASHLYDFVWLVFWLHIGINFLMTQCALMNLSDFGKDWLVLMSFLGANILLNAPFGILQRQIDKEYGFNKQSFKEYCIDSIKGFILGAIFVGILLAILLLVMEMVELWWLVGFVLIFCSVILIQLVYPTLIAPMFNKFTPLQNENLKQRIQNLMEVAGFKSNGIFVMDASKRDGRLNAYFGGLGSSKRVVLFDTLLDKISEDGLIAILGHELGHFKHRDILHNIIIVSFIMFLMFAITGLLFQPLCVYLNFTPTHSNILILAMLLLPVFTFFLKPIISYFSRKAEYRADEFGASCATKEALREALIRLVNENKSFPYSHPAYIFFYYSHPPLIKRLKTLGWQNDRD